MEWVAAAISMVGAVAVAWLGKRSSQAAEKVRATAAPYEALAERVATLEAQVDEARKTIHRISTDLDHERASRRAAEVRLADLGRLLAVEQERAGLLAQRVTQLEAELEAGGLPIPPPYPIPGGIE